MDALRLVASVGVIFYHYSEYITPDLWPSGEAPDLGRFRLWVDVFFAISGFVLGHVYADQVGRGFRYGLFLQKRVARLLPLHVVTLGFYVALGLLMFVGIKPDSANRFDWSCLVPNLLLVHGWGVCRAVSFNTPSWSISAEMAMYLLFPLFVMLARPGRGLLLLVLAAVAIALLELWSTYPGAQYWLLRASQGGALRAVPSFLFGLALHARRDWLMRLPVPALAAGLSAAAFLAALFSNIAYLPLLLIGYCWVASMVALDVQKRTGRLLTMAGRGGELTYSLYMLHMPVATVMMTLAKRVLHLGSVATIGWLFVMFAVLWIASSISYRWFEMPARRWLAASGRRSKLIPSTGKAS
ncbi:hypothetical protein ASE78_17195 [Sphingomonas sp. Leaf25]|nr:hypothetical protein ASE78_17195 [Sphingomonas sp. Leaf25]